MKRPPVWFAVMAIALGVAASSPAFTREPTARQYLDRQTGATITAMERAFVFARERPALAVNARDYISLVGVDVNRGGQHLLYWYGYSWSTIDGGGADETLAPVGWLLLADGRPIALRPVAQTPEQVGIGKIPLPRPVRGARTVLFAADAEELEFVARGGDLSVQRADGDTKFTLWRDARQYLQGWLAARLH